MNTSNEAHHDWARMSRDDALDLAEREAYGEIAMTIDGYVNRIQRHLEPGTPGVTTEGLRADLQRQSTRRARAEWCLTRLQLSHRLGMDVLADVISAKGYGATWDAIGKAVGITAAEAEARWLDDAAECQAL